MKKKIPEFGNEEQAFEFWSKADSTEYVDWSKAERKKLPALRPSLRTISVRLPVAMVEDLKILAHQRDVPYQSLLKMYLADRIDQERKKKRA
jgi:predicted DNA binding CopG/RHH family protein